jgi:dUTP pyrophosphatase
MRKFRRLNQCIETELPRRATKYSAGYDIHSAVSAEIKPGEKYVIPTNTAVEMGEDDVLLIFPRSSYSIKFGLELVNSVGVIDADYKDQIFICYRNTGDEPFFIKRGDRIAQGVFVKFFKTDDDSASGERRGGVGSTGV